MNRGNQAYLPLEIAYQRKAMFAIELLDAVSLSRLSQGLTVTASGLLQKPIINNSGLFVWLLEDVSAFKKISVEPGVLPFENIEILANQVRMGELLSIELPPRRDYPFVPGVTGIRGTLIERRVIPSVQGEPVVDAKLRLMWLDDDGITWRDAPTETSTDLNGDFVTVIRFISNDVHLLDTTGGITVQLLVTRTGQSDRRTPEFLLQPGRVVDKLFSQGSVIHPVTLAWNELLL